MSAVSKKVVKAVRLSETAHDQLNTMLKQVFGRDKYSKISLSTLVSFIITEYCERNFEKDIEKIVSVYRNKRKVAHDVLSKVGEGQLTSILKVLEKISKEDDTQN